MDDYQKTNKNAIKFSRFDIIHDRRSKINDQHDVGMNTPNKKLRHHLRDLIFNIIFHTIKVWFGNPCLSTSLAS
jgi:hypothetical protein